MGGLIPSARSNQILQERQARFAGINRGRKLERSSTGVFKNVYEQSEWPDMNTNGFANATPGNATFLCLSQLNWTSNGTTVTFIRVSFPAGWLKKHPVI